MLHAHVRSYANLVHTTQTKSLYVRFHQVGLLLHLRLRLRLRVRRALLGGGQVILHGRHLELDLSRLGRAERRVLVHAPGELGMETWSG